MSLVRQKLLDAFKEADGNFISGEKLANQIGCSRTAVWKHIEELRNEGFQVEAIRKKGYRLIDNPNKMSADDIYLGLTTNYIGKKIFHYDTIDSTQTIAKEMAVSGEKEGTLIVADEQTAGRGRMARGWHSAKGSGIWMSLIIKPSIPIQKAPQLTLLTAVAVVQAIEEVAEIDCHIKWPNDILINGKKVCGILTELMAEENHIQSIIIGIGLNVNQQMDDFPEEIRPTASSVRVETGKEISRTQLLQLFCSKFEKLYEIYLNQSFIPIKLLWESYASSIGKRITARTINGVYRGIALGITDEGVLQLQSDDGFIHQLYSADIEIE